MEWDKLLKSIQGGDTKSLARGISLIENEYPGYEEFMKMLPAGQSRIIGITGPPGAGKSTLVDALIRHLVDQNKKTGVVCVDPSSPFNRGALLGDRIRMSDWYTHPNVYIRSLAARGAMGGLHPKIIEITDLMKAFPFDHIIVETVGVGQSEIEIAGLADVTAVVLVPEGGDEIQTMKAGLMEIADVFVVNKSDRPGADLFVKHLHQMLAPSFGHHYQEVPIIKTIASENTGVPELAEILLHQLQKAHLNDKNFWLLAEKAWYLIEQKRMKDISKSDLKKRIEDSFDKGQFNLYKFLAEYFPS